MLDARWSSMTPTAKAAMVDAMTQDCTTLAIAGIRAANPIRRGTRRRGVRPDKLPVSLSPLDLAFLMADSFERLTIPYVLGGSLASSIVAEPRTTVDIDMAIRLKPGDVDRLIHEVSPSFYVPVRAARLAAQEHDSFNIIHNIAVFKVDLFVLGTGPLDVGQMERRVRYQIGPDPTAALWVTSTEDQILRKLDWFRRGGRVSDRQWRDVLSILRVGGTHLDEDYLNVTAGLVELSDLLSQARQAAERSP